MAGRRIEVLVAYAEPARQELRRVHVAHGASVLEAVERSGILDTLAAEQRARVAFAIYGERVDPRQPLEEGDRVEILRPLEVDPKEARRRRVRRSAR